jgi:APA family basic amino acid/polyamine antiporter
VALVNFRGVSESVKTNVVLTMVELSGLLLVIFVGLYAVTQGNADFSRVVVFESANDKSVFFALSAATALAFFAMVGFEDSVNMAEECQDPIRDFPKMMLTGLGVTGVIYLLVSITAVALVPVGDLTNADLGPALNQVVAAGAPELPFDKIFPFIGMFAVANSALINMLMASRLLYGMANQDVLPRSLGKVHATRRTPWVAIIFTTLLSFGLIIYVVRASASEDGLANITLLGGTTALLLLCVFTVVNIALLVLRKQPVDHDHFRAPTFLPVIGALTCAFLAGPWARADKEQYKIAGLMMAVGLVLWVLTWLTNRGVRAKKTGFRDIEHMEDDAH